MYYDSLTMKSKLKQEGPMDVYTIRLTAAHAICARRFGCGNVSDGVRVALEVMRSAQGGAAPAALLLRPEAQRLP